MKDSAETRLKLLAAASHVFAEMGYRDATIAEICRRAGANIAAVSYHFGSKERLYVETFSHGCAQSIQAHPPDGGVAGDAPPDERLRGQVKSLLSRISDANNMEFLIVLKERANPTGLLQEVLKKQLRPLHERLDSVIRELLGPRATDEQVRFCGLSIISQCLDPVAVTRGDRGRRQWGRGEPVISDIDAYADHVVEFSLAGIRSLRATVEKERGGARASRGARMLADGRGV